MTDLSQTTTLSSFVFSCNRLSVSETMTMTCTVSDSVSQTKCSTHLVRTDGAEGFLRRVRGQGKRVDFGQTWLYVKLTTCMDMHADTDRPCKTHEEGKQRIKCKWSECHAECSHSAWSGSVFGYIVQLFAAPLHLCFSLQLLMHFKLVDLVFFFLLQWYCMKMF